MMMLMNAVAPKMTRMVVTILRASSPLRLVYQTTILIVRDPTRTRHTTGGRNALNANPITHMYLLHHISIMW